MENQIEILVIGTHQTILETVLRLLNKNPDWEATGVADVQAAIAACTGKNYQVLLLGAGLTAAEEQTLTETAIALRPAIHVIPHYGGGSGLLFAEIYLALGIKNQAQ